MKFTGKLVLITSGSDGFDVASALKFAEAGADLAIIYQEKEQAKIQQLVYQVKEMGQQILTLLVDLKDREAIDWAVEEVVQEFGKIDIYLNTSLNLENENTFIGEEVPDWRKGIRANLTVTFNCCQKVGLEMSRQGFGKMINVYKFDLEAKQQSQTFAWTVKECISGLTRNMAKELAHKNVIVNTIESGLANSKDLVSTIFFLASTDADYITGQVLVVDMGLEAKCKVGCL